MNKKKGLDEEQDHPIRPIYIRNNSTMSPQCDERRDGQRQAEVRRLRITRPAHSATVVPERRESKSQCLTIGTWPAICRKRA